MKIDRLLGIITTLLQRDKVTAPELAKKYEVSRRTILRDIDDICKAGIPIITYQGGDGGISIAEGYKLDKSVLTIDELHSIIAGLKSIGSVSDSARIEGLISKLSPKSGAVVSIKDSIIIDLSSHYKSSLSEKINLIKSAIKDNKLVTFDYYSEKGLSRRTIEPYFITFKWTSWYVFGYCRDRNCFHLFKLNRLWRHEVLDEMFVPKTGLNSSKVKFFTQNNKASVCYCDGENNISLIGTIDVLTDPELKKQLWLDWFINHFQGGISDPNYCILKFTTKEVTFWIDNQYGEIIL